MTDTDTRRGQRASRPTATSSLTAIPRNGEATREMVDQNREQLRSHLTDVYSQSTADYAVNTLRMWSKYGHQSPYVAPLWEYANRATGADLPDTVAVRKSYAAWSKTNMLTHPHADSGVATSYPRAPDALRAAIETVAEVSRGTLRDQYGETLQVYRGIDEHVWENHTEFLPDGGVRIEPLAMDSWTLSEDIAETYGRYTLERTVDVDDVLFYGDLFMSEQPEEREITVGGHTAYEIPFADLSWERL